MRAIDPGAATIDLSVVVVNWNTRDLLCRCLASVYQTVTALQFEVLVVDNGSSDCSADLVSREFPTVKLILNPDNVGFARANNQAIRASAGRYILLLNSDAVLLDGAATRLIEFLETHPRAGIVGGKLLNPDGSFQASFFDFPGFGDELLLLTGLSRLLRPPTYPSHPEIESRVCRPADWVSGACLMARRAAVNAIGLLDEHFFMYSEEMDWCYRMNQGGWAVYFVPDATVLHGSGESYRRVPEQKRAHLYHGKLLYMRKHGGRWRATAFRLLIGAVSVCKLLAWLLASLGPDPALRERSRQHVASYRFLLANL